MAAEPSVALAEALKSISHATLSALRAYEQGSRSQAAQLEDELSRVRQERDDAVADMYESRQKEQAWQQEIEKWKVATEKLEIGRSHLSDLVAQLRDEAQQWKDQCLRLEETSRQEIQDWKEQFLRVDAERLRLTARIDHLASDNQVCTYAEHHHASDRLLFRGLKPPLKTTPFTPRIKHSSTVDPMIASSSTKRASTYAAIPGKLIKTTSNAGEPSTRLSSTKKPRHSQPLPLAQEPVLKRSSTTGAAPVQTRVVRRVQALIEVPVKEEEDEYNGIEAEEGVEVASYTSGSASGNGRKGRSSRSRTSRRVVSDEDESYHGSEEDEYADPGQYVPRRANTSGRRRRVDHPPDEEDDELMMGVEDDANDVYGAQRVVSVAGRSKPTNTPNSKANGATPTTRKRKQVPADAVTASAPPKARKRR
ncbi:hypothetical protein EVG20_g4006 [Dentipellis fragilis]|uniref:Uncharacterized protein n=1 Tax=Dentipellis fragilis TaxID=205917 RepID=A0A4Y9YYA8_9AGAM|nr:hypothetical protein EVG20_g4006 [Dentipellis fragilis]